MKDERVFQVLVNDMVVLEGTKKEIAEAYGWKYRTVVNYVERGFASKGITFVETTPAITENLNRKKKNTIGGDFSKKWEEMRRLFGKGEQNE